LKNEEDEEFESIDGEIKIEIQGEASSFDRARVSRSRDVQVSSSGMHMSHVNSRILSSNGQVLAS
jgi:hypothetical protein